MAVTIAEQATATTITFDLDPRPGGSLGISEYVESGFRFKRPGPPVEPPNGLTRNFDSGSGWPKSGSPYLQLLRNRTMEFFRIDGKAFQLVQLDLAEYSTVYPIPREITVLGYRPDGSVVSDVFEIDGYLTDFVPGISFETFVLGPGFDNLIRAEVATDLVSIENVVVQPVPEPQSAVLAIVGFAALGVLLTGTRRNKAPRGQGELAPAEKRGRTSKRAAGS